MADKDKIEFVPDCPTAIIDAVNNDKFALFIGAGISRLIGCIGWDKLAKNLINRCYGDGIINFKEKESLSKLNDQRKIITIAFKMLSKKIDVFYDEMQIALLENKKELIKIPNIYEDLEKMHALNITTNADTHYDRLFSKQNIIFRPEFFNPETVSRTKLYHLHGSINVYDSLIFTLPKYFELYNHEKIKAFLRNVFSSYTVLFIGYGLAEFELLEFIIGKNYKNEKEALPKRFILADFYQGEENLVKMEQSYYQEMNIQVIPYAKDISGFKQLAEIIAIWSRQLNRISKYKYDSISIIDEAIQNPSEDNINEVLGIIKNNESHKKYFFNNIKKTTNIEILFKYLDDAGYFNPQYIPLPHSDLYNKEIMINRRWYAFIYLEVLSKKLKQTKNKKLINRYSQIIDEIIQYEKSFIKSKDYSPDWSMVEIIFNLPVNKIKAKYFTYLLYLLGKNTFHFSVEIYEHAFPALISENDNAKLKKLTEIILRYKKSTSKFLGSKLKNYNSIIDNYYLSKIIQDFGISIFKLLGYEAFQIAQNKMDMIIKYDKPAFSYSRIQTIEDHPQTRQRDEYVDNIIVFIRNYFEQSRPSKLKTIIRELLYKEHPIYLRIAIFAINRHFNKLEYLFWNWINDVGNPLNIFGIKHELYELFKSKISSFPSEKVELILDFIENLEIHIPDDKTIDDNDIQMKIAYRKREWLSAISKSNNPLVNDNIQYYENINSAPVSHPGFYFWTESGSGTISPITKEKLLNMKNKDLVDYLNEFSGDDRYDGPSKDGLSEILKLSVIEKPTKFSRSLQLFLKVEHVYISAILRGLLEVWKSKKMIDWNNIIIFIENLVSSVDFYSVNNKDERFDYTKWCILDIADLITEGTREDDNAFSPELLSMAENILLKIANNIDSDLKYSPEVVNEVLNSMRGRVYTALVNYSLRYARVYKHQEKQRWKKQIKLFFEERILKSPEVSSEIWSIMGQFLPNIAYLDNEWLEDNINNIFPVKLKDQWLATMHSYLFFSTTVYKNLYILLKENNQYLKTIKTKFDDEYISKKLVNHIGVGYLEEFDDINDNDSLLKNLLENKRADQLEDLVSYICDIKLSIIGKKVEKIIILWRILYDILYDLHIDPEYQSAVGKLVNWLSILNEFDDEVLKWIKFSSIYVNRSHELHRLVENLLLQATKNPNNVAEVYLHLIKNDIYPDYKEDNIIQTIDIIFNSGLKEKANIICNAYFDIGKYFLRDVFNKYNQ